MAAADDKQKHSERKRRSYTPPVVEESAPFQRLVLTCSQTNTTCTARGDTQFS